MRSTVAPNILFLMETKNQDPSVFHVCQPLGFSNRFTVPPLGLSGGLALFWSDNVSLEVLASSPHFIDTKIKFQGIVSFITFTYGAPQVENIAEIWDLISSLGSSRDEPWLLTGDFNEILDSSEKVGGPLRSEGSLIPFRSFVSQNGLWDLPFSGNNLSWRGQRHTHFILSRLDRSLANCSWTETFPSGHSSYLRYEGSDHRPLVTVFDSTKRKGSGIFRFDRRLRGKPEVTPLISEAWGNPSSPAPPIYVKLSDCKRTIIQWTREQNATKTARNKASQEALEAALSSELPDPNLIATLQDSVATDYREEEEFWRQRSRIQWLQHGDSNTSFFHAATRGRRAINNLSMIEDAEGTTHHEDHLIGKVVADFYQKLFTSDYRDPKAAVDEALQTRVTPAMNEALTKLPDEKEIKEAVFSVHPDKAPGPDGFSAGFYHSYWEIISFDVYREIRSFFESGFLHPRYNETHVRLIPKDLGSKKVADFRPIALCSAHYKIIAKILCKRLQPFLSTIISKHQSAFVPKRAIADNVLITHETLHFLRLSKAQKHCSVIPTRGLRQGDPLSPYLFILCTEVLSGLCRNAQERGALPGVRVSRQSLAINHLLFADDTMFFTKTNPTSVSALLSVIRTYENASGQCINPTKSSVTFSSKTPSEVKALVKSSLGIEKEGGVGKYLGLPEHFGRCKKDIFTGIVDKVRKKAHSWTSGFLSGAGKQVLLKSVLSTMPSYAMSCFKLPKSLCKRLQTALTRFWWDDKPDKRKMSWVSWDKLSVPKNGGGLDFREIEIFNDAQLAKIGWRLLNQPDSLLAQVLLGKYCHSSHFLAASPPSNASHGWRGILAGREILRKGLGWTIGEGKDVNLWTEPWLSISTPTQPIGPPPEHLRSLVVGDLIHQHSNSWNVDAIHMVVPQHEEEIRKLVLGSKRSKDALRWLHCKSGEYTTKTGYAISKLHNEPVHADGFNWQTNLWRVKTSPKLKHFLWKASANALSVGAALIGRGFNTDGRCVRCGEVEDVRHVLLTCPYAQTVWNLAPVLFKPNPVDCPNMKALLLQARKLVNLPPTGLSLTPLFPWLVWFLWKARNLLIFEERIVSAQDTYHKAISEAKAWQHSRTASNAASDQSNLPPSLTPRFLPPPDVLSCYTDAAWQASDLRCGAGWIIKNSVGDIVLQGTEVRDFIPSALAAEATAVLLALTYARAANVSQVACFSDCLELISLLNSGGLSLGILGLLIDI
ncbi:unnamed protein product, partial [Microthlaspi erraticum]